MLPFTIQTPHEVSRAIGLRVRARRLERGLTQSAVARRSGVSLSSVKRFEQTGAASLLSLLRIAMVLDALADFEGLFPAPVVGSLDEAVAARKPRQRGGIK